ncbi:MAG: hypothetical protein Q8Q14_12715 [Gemmatimonadales bacterium]|nr:hypothetical protein [Gemmatimonadales bacterium]
MSKSEDERMAKLIRKNVAKAQKAKPKPRRYDPTLPPETTEEDMERREFFKEMKKREF